MSAGTSTTRQILLTDFGFVGGTYNVVVACSGVVTKCNNTPPTVTVMPGANQTISVPFTVGTSAGTNNITVTLTKSGLATLVATITVTVTAETKTFTVSGSSSHGTYQNAAICAVACFAARHAHGTVPYITMDTPRQLTLTYNSDWAFPHPVVYAQVSSTNVINHIDQYWLQLKTASGTFVTFSNGETQVKFSGTNTGGQLAAQFNASSYGTGVYPMTIVVTAHYTDGTTIQNTTPITIVVVNTGLSDPFGVPAGNGWSLVESQRVLYQANTNGYLVLEGSGNAIYYPSLGATAADYTKLTYDSTTATFTRAYPDSTKIIFNATGYITKAMGRHGLYSLYQYDGSNRLQFWDDPMRAMYTNGQSYLQLAYGTSGLASITQAGGVGPNRVMSVNVSGNQLTSITDPDTHGENFGYDASGRLSTVTDRGGNTKTIAYNAFTWRIASETFPTVPIDAGGGSTTNAAPVIQYTAWQGFGVPQGSTATTPASIIPLGTIQGSIKDPTNHITAYRVGSWGQPTTITDALNRTTSISDALLPTNVNHPDGTYEQYTYNGPYLTGKYHSGGSWEYYSYTTDGQIDSVWGAATRTRRYIYTTGNHQVYKVLSKITATTSDTIVVTAYDTKTQQWATIYESGRVYQSTYNQTIGNLTQQTAPGGRVSTKLFDAYGRDSVITPPGAVGRTYTYDVLNRPTSDSLLTSFAAIINRYTYDALHLTDVRDPNGNVIHTDYNALGWATQGRDPLLNVMQYRYDASGLLTSYTNRRGQVVSMTYDAVGRVLTKSGTNTTSDSYSYASNDKMSTAANTNATDSIFVNPTALNDSTVFRVGGGRYRIFHAHMNTFKGTDSVTVAANTSVTFRTRYWNVDSLTGQLRQYQDGFNTTRFTYSPNGDRDSTIGSLGGARVETHTTIHRDGAVSYGTGNINHFFYRAYVYDTLGRAAFMTRGAGASADWRQMSYTYDPVGRINSAGEVGLCDSTQTWVDSTRGVGHTCGSSFLSHVFYTYDAGGNRTSQHGVYGTGNRIQSFGATTDPYGPYIFEHDLDGNITRKYNTSTGEDRRYTWSADNRLLGVVDGTQSVNYYYDALGRPVMRYRNGALERWWVWDGDHLYLEVDGSANRAAEYLYYPGSTDHPYGMITGSTAPTTMHYLQQDELGNITGHYEAYSTGTTVNQAVYYPDPWGKPDIHTSADSRLYWKGLMWEGDIVGLYYMRNRWYDPEIGRFVSEDPIGVAGGANLYAFGGNDPVNEIDPSGTSGDDFQPDPNLTCPSGYYLQWGYHKDGNGNISDVTYTCRPQGDSGGDDVTPIPTNSGGGYIDLGGGWISGPSYIEPVGGSGGPSMPPALSKPALKPAQQFKDCLAEDPALRYIAPWSLVPLLNLKAPWELREGASVFTSIDRRLPRWTGADIDEGVTVIRGTIGRAKPLGRLGTIGAAISGFATSYTITAMARCVLQ